MTYFIKQFHNYLINNKNKYRADKEKAYLYSDMVHYGVAKKQRTDFLKQHKKQLKQLSKKEVIILIIRLWNQPSFEEKDMALDILKLKTFNLDLSDMEMIETFIRQAKGWALLDNLVIPVMPIILANDKMGYDYLKKWIKEDDFWIRRSALLAQLLFFRYDSGGDRQLFFNLAKSQFNEEWINKIYKDKLANKRAKFFIRKAIGWILREMSAKQPQVVYQFLVENKNNMSGLTFREGSRKLSKKSLTRRN